MSNGFVHAAKALGLAHSIDTVHARSIGMLAAHPRAPDSYHSGGAAARRRFTSNHHQQPPPTVILHSAHACTGIIFTPATLWHRPVGVVTASERMVQIPLPLVMTL